MDMRSTSKARGKRLLLARKMIGLSRIAFQQKHHISASTIQSWETAKAGGLTQRGAEKVLRMLHQEGLVCSLEWLLYGIGSTPQFNPAATSSDKQQLLLPEDQAIIQELLLFRRLHPNTFDMKVEDDGMLPHFQPGEYVAGESYPIDAIAHLNGMDCIVRTEQNNIFLRRVRHLNADICNLMCVNPESTVQMIVLYQQRITQVAPVIWHRKNKIMV